MRMIGVDVGGTFTDIAYCDMASGDIAIHKVSTTPDDPSRAVLQGISELCAESRVDPGSVDYVLHGTTTATNAVLEHKGARTGLVTNQGFRDPPRGDELEPLNEADVVAAAEALRQYGVEAIAGN